MLSKAQRLALSRAFQAHKLPRRAFRTRSAGHAFKAYRKARARAAFAAYRGAQVDGASPEGCKRAAALAAAKVQRPKMAQIPRNNAPMAPNAPKRETGKRSRIANREISAAECTPEAQEAYKAALAQRDAMRAASAEKVRVAVNKARREARAARKMKSSQA